MTFPIPVRVTIGFAEYSVRLMTAEEAAESDHYGVTDVDQLEIRMNGSVPSHRLIYVLLHEMMHGAWDMGDLNDVEGEEKAVTVLSLQLCQMLRDNADLFQRMIAELQKPPLRSMSEVLSDSLRERLRQAGPHGIVHVSDEEMALMRAT
jgi:hypothetical protein